MSHNLLMSQRPKIRQPSFVRRKRKKNKNCMDKNQNTIYLHTLNIYLNINRISACNEN